MQLRTEAIYHCEPEYYLEQYFDEAGRSRREVEGVGTVSFKVLESSREGGVWRHVAESIERVNAPMPVRKIFGETTRMEEHASWRQGTNVIQTEYRPDTMKKKISILTQIRVAPHGDGHCRITVEVEVLFKIFGIGRLLERFAAKEMPKAIEKDCAFFNAHMAPK